MTANNVLKCLIFISLVMSSYCYFYIIPGEMGKSKDHEDYCFFNDTQALIKRGESVIVPTCEEISCGSDYSISIYGCGTFMIHDPSCNKWERDYSKPYPECCNAFICVEPSKQEVSISEVENNSLD